MGWRDLIVDCWQIQGEPDDVADVETQLRRGRCQERRYAGVTQSGMTRQESTKGGFVLSIIQQLGGAGRER